MGINTTGYWALVMRALMETGDIASVYTQLENPDNFYIGYIAHMSARHFAMRVMDIDGAHDGWLIGRNSDVMQVVAGDDYEVRMKWLETLLGRMRPPIRSLRSRAKTCLPTTRARRRLRIW